MKLHKYQRGDEMLAFVLVLLFIVFVLLPVALVLLDYKACHAKWDRAGMSDVSWGPVQGCLVQMSDGRWLPEDRVREIEIPKPTTKTKR